MREKLAKLAHKQWSGWMKYIFSKCSETCPEDGKLFHENCLIIPPWAVERWGRQANIPYKNLSEKEKDSDRAEADKFLVIFQETIEQLQDRINELNETYIHNVKIAGQFKQQIKQLQAELDKHRWIPVSERLPENIPITLVLFDSGNIIQAICADWVNIEGKLNEHITHWKPIILPEKTLKGE